MGVAVKSLLAHLRERQEQCGVQAFQFHHVLRNNVLEAAAYPTSAQTILESEHPEDQVDSKGLKPSKTIKEAKAITIQKNPIAIPPIGDNGSNAGPSAFCTGPAFAPRSTAGLESDARSKLLGPSLHVQSKSQLHANLPTGPSHVRPPIDAAMWSAARIASPSHSTSRTTTPIFGAAGRRVPCATQRGCAWNAIRSSAPSTQPID